MSMLKSQSEQQNHAQDRGAPAKSKPLLSSEWKYTIGIRLFQAAGQPANPASLPKVNDFPAHDLLPGHLCQAARLLLGISQAELRELSMVSKKSINDFENGFAAIGEPLVIKLRTALEEQGARFVAGEDVTGVLTVMDRSDLEGRSRSPRKSGNAPP